tara:strand:+ start:610 stop:1020 length:411 start_codon:yes stop_codon:yes gene_type:complete
MAATKRIKKIDYKSKPRKKTNSRMTGVSSTGVKYVKRKPNKNLGGRRVATEMRLGDYDNVADFLAAYESSNNNAEIRGGVHNRRDGTRADALKSKPVKVTAKRRTAATKAKVTRTKAAANSRKSASPRKRSATRKK